MYTIEQLCKRLKRLEKKFSCLVDCDECEDCAIPEGPCEFDSDLAWTEQTGGIQYRIIVSYIEPLANINVQLIKWESTTDQTPQQFLDILSATYGPNMVFSLNEDGTVHLVANGFAAACFLKVITNQQLPNTTASWDSPNSVQFNVMSVYTGTTNQGYFNGPSWGGNTPPSTSAGYMPFGADTDKISMDYDAAIPSALSVCVHLIQDGNEIAGSPFNVGIPASGLGTVEITGLLDKLNPAFDLTILVDTAC